jgi:hypothetical protein
MKARGKREAQRNASPLVTKKYFEPSTESAKYQRELFRSFRASRPLRELTRGDAPHVVRRLPLAFIFRAFGAGPWLSYSAPSGLDRGFHIPRLRRWTVAFIFRVFGAQFRLFVQSPSISRDKPQIVGIAH